MFAGERRLTDSLQKHVSAPLLYSFNTYSSMTLQSFIPMCINQEEREIQLLCSFSSFKVKFIRHIIKKKKKAS